MLNEGEDNSKLQGTNFPKEKPILISLGMLNQKPTNQIDLEKGLSRIPPFTCLMIVILTLIFFLEASYGALESSENLVRAGALYQFGFFHGEIWRLVTAIFLHANFGHLFGNCIVFYIVGITCEHVYGSKQTAGAFFFCGICGCLLSVMFHVGPMLGASGAILGLMALLISSLWMYEDYFTMRNKQIYIMVLLCALYIIGSGFFTPFVDNLGHIGGAISGAFSVFFWRPLIVNRR